MIVDELINRKNKIGAVGALDFLIEFEKKRSGVRSSDISMNFVGVRKSYDHVPGRDALFRDYLRRAEAKKDLFALDATILRNDSLNGRELLAWRASRGRLDEQGIRGLAEVARSESFKQSARESIRTLLDPEWTLRLARIMLIQRARPDDVLTGLTLLDCLYDQPEAAKIVKTFGRLFFDIALAEGDVLLAKSLVDKKKLNNSSIRTAMIDLNNPFCGPFCDPDWLTMFNQFYTEHNIEPICFFPDKSEDNGNIEPFDRVYCDVPAGTIDGPLVTVIVTSFNPDEKLVTAVRSVLQQTYRNIEVLIIDDASTDAESHCYLEKCQQLDSRVSVHIQPVNGGTYIARNKGLSLASGEFVTGQDSDDWSHPRRIELQVQPLLQDAALPATQSLAIRCSSKLKLGNEGRVLSDRCASSLMFRRKMILEQLGDYDTVRKGADNELIHRIEAFFSREVIILKKPLSLLRLTTEGISRKDFRPGWRHPARRAYHRAYEHWHEMIRNKNVPAKCLHNKEKRFFPAPFSFLPENASGNYRHYDVVFAGDWVSDGGPQKSMLEEIRSLDVSGLKIGICDMEAFRFMTTSSIKTLCSEIRDMLHAGVIEEVLLTDTVEVCLLIIRYPPILQFTPRNPSCWTINKAVLIANQAPCEADGSDLRYLTNECTDNAKNLFGVEPLWVPQGPHVRIAIEKLIPPSLLSSVNNPGIIDREKWVGTREKGRRSMLCIGRYSRDTPVKFPETKELMLEIYPSSGYDVHFLGGVKSMEVLFGNKTVPRNWHVYPFGSVSPQQFLDSIDIFLYFDNSIIVEAFGRSILEAMASGCVLILPKKFEEVFGPGPIYCDSHQVKNELEKLQQDREYFRSRQELTRQTLTQSFTYQSFLTWVYSLLDSSRTP